MPYQVTPEVNFASVGLITDVPAHETPLGSWTDCLDVRVKDGSVQAVNSFADDFTPPPAYEGMPVVAVTQWTPAGSGFLNIAYIIKDTGSTTGTKGRVFVYNTHTLANEEITNATAGANFEIDDTYAPQIFVFNEVLIVNPGTGTPQYISADATTAGNLVDLPNWLAMASTQYARVMKPFKNRLIAMSFFDDKGTVIESDDESFPIDLAWSSHITSLSDITGLEWQASSVNTAGDAFLAQTPGRILDGGQLGEFFIAYKSDAVIRIYETGDNFILGFDSIFEDDGIYSTRCFANIGDAQHLVVGTYGVYIHDGQSQKQDIAKGLFQESLFNAVDNDNKERSFVFRQSRDKEIWFCFPIAEETTEGCHRAYVFNYADQKVHIRTLPSVSDLYESELNGDLVIYAATPTGVKTLTSDSYETGGFFESIQEKLGDITSFKEVAQIFPASQGDFDIALVGTSHPETLFDWTYRTFYPLTGYKIDVRVSGRFLNIRVNLRDSINPKLTTMQFKVRPAGLR